jgi:hypothetical protein
MFFIQQHTKFDYPRNLTWAGHADHILVCKHQQNRLFRTLKWITEDHIKLCVTEVGCRCMFCSEFASDCI